LNSKLDKFLWTKLWPAILKTILTKMGKVVAGFSLRTLKGAATLKILYFTHSKAYFFPNGKESSKQNLEKRYPLFN